MDESAVATNESLSERQEKVLSILPIFSSLLSIWGSTSIIIMYKNTSKRSRNCYKRIMLGLSCTDLVMSTTLALQAFLLPRSGGVVWAIGNEASCNVMGFFQQFGFSAVWYNGMLSWMFLLTIKYSVSEEDLAQKYEPWMHGTSILFNLITAAIGAGFNMYDELSLGLSCWFTGNPGTFFAYFASALPVILVFIAIPVNNFLIYYHVKHLLLSNVDNESESNVELQVTTESLYNMCDTANQQQNQEDNETITSGRTTYSNEQIRQESEDGREHPREQARQQARQQSLLNRQRERLKDVAHQSCLYVGSFYITHFTTFIIRLSSAIIGANNLRRSMYPLLVIQAIMLPLQGLFNYTIYSRPFYLREALGRDERTNE